MLTAELDPDRDVEWDEAVAAAGPLGCVPVEATDPLYIINVAGHRLSTGAIEEVLASHAAVLVGRLPKTRSGKILRGTMRRIADGDAYTTPATIDDPAILDEIHDALRELGYAPRHTAPV